MTNTAELRQRTRAATDNLAQISGNLTAALEDVALLERLKSAPDRAARLTADKEKATKERDRALAAEANDYLMKAPEGDHPGREYVVHGVRVVEGQPRWAVQNRQVVDERFLVPDIATTTNVIVRGLRGERLGQPGYRQVFP